MFTTTKQKNMKITKEQKEFIINYLQKTYGIILKKDTRFVFDIPKEADERGRLTLLKEVNVKGYYSYKEDFSFQEGSWVFTGTPNQQTEPITHNISIHIELRIDIIDIKISYRKNVKGLFLDGTAYRHFIADHHFDKLMQNQLEIDGYIKFLKGTGDFRYVSKYKIIKDIPTDYKDKFLDKLINDIFIEGINEFLNDNKSEHPLMYNFIKNKIRVNRIKNILNS